MGLQGDEEGPPREARGSKDSVISGSQRRGYFKTAGALICVECAIHCIQNEGDWSGGRGQTGVGGKVTVR